jgi:hypothetical protein
MSIETVNGVVAIISARLGEVARERDAAVNQLLDMRAQRDSLAERLRQTPDTRDIIGHLRAIQMELQVAAWKDARKRVTDLLRRLDESPNTTTPTL